MPGETRACVRSCASLCVCVYVCGCVYARVRDRGDEFDDAQMQEMGRECVPVSSAVHSEFE